jgi:hypothetical protein
MRFQSKIKTVLCILSRSLLLTLESKIYAINTRKLSILNTIIIML